MDKKDLGDIQQELERLKARVGKLEERLGIKPGEDERVVDQEKAQVAESKEPKPTKESLEERIGGTWLNRLGIVALLVGLGLALKFAFDRNLITEYGRIILGYLGGVLLLGGGFWFRRRLPKFAVGLIGGGVGALYITTYAAYKFYSMIGNVTAFVLLIGITVGAVALAFVFDNSVIASLGFLGGYITPLLIHTGGGTYVELFAYLLILNLGAAALLSSKRWTWLSGISLVSTWVLFGVGMNRFDDQVHLLGFMLFLTVYQLIFIALGISNNFIHRQDTDTPLAGVIVLSGIGYAIFSADMLLPSHGWGLAAIFAGWGVLYFLLMRGVKHWRTQDTKLSLLLLILALGYFAIAVPVFLKGIWTTIAWTIMAVSVSLAGAKIGHLRLRQFGLILVVLALFRLIFIDLKVMGAGVLETWRRLPQFSLTERLPAILAVGAGILILAWLYLTPRYEITLRERAWGRALAVLGNLVLLVGILSEIDRYFKVKLSLRPLQNWDMRRDTAWTITMAVYGFILVAIGLWRRYRLIRWLGIYLLLATVAKVILFDLTGLEMGWRILVFFCTGLILLAASYLYQKYKSEHLN